ncbi:hypothetical protein [Micromonospora chalcea]|uniref:hypothetical protein n=1 Tax=Micromonospora chalcea TaxID=1874 RepID=UPI003D75FDB9
MIVVATDQLTTLEEAWEVAAVVLGEEQRALEGWQLDAAIAAMTALGDSDRHIAWWLGLHRGTVYKKLAQQGRKPNYSDQRLDYWGIWVVTRGGRAALRGKDRLAAMKIMARRGLNNAEIAGRLMMNNPASVTQIGVRFGIKMVAANAKPHEVDAFHRGQQVDPLPEEQQVNDYVRHLLGHLPESTPSEGLIAA